MKSVIFLVLFVSITAYSQRIYDLEKKLYNIGATNITTVNEVRYARSYTYVPIFEKYIKFNYKNNSYKLLYDNWYVEYDDIPTELKPFFEEEVKIYNKKAEERKIQNNADLKIVGYFIGGIFVFIFIMFLFCRFNHKTK